MSAAEWDAFATWLEDSPAHARAYDAVAMADAQLTPPETMAEVAPEPVAAPVVPLVPAPTASRRRRRARSAPTATA